MNDGDGTGTDAHRANSISGITGHEQRCLWPIFSNTQVGRDVYDRELVELQHQLCDAEWRAKGDAGSADDHGERRQQVHGQTAAFAETDFTASGLQNDDRVGSVMRTSDGAAAAANLAGSPYGIAAVGVIGTFNPANYPHRLC